MSSVSPLSRGLRLAVALSVNLLLLLSLTTTYAASANISHAYHAAQPIAVGSIVSLDPKRSNYVQATDTSNAVHLLGVATDDSLLAINGDGQANSLQIATSGTANVLVSTINGPIGVGDNISVSPFSGIGMKTTSDTSTPTIGVAQTALSNSTPSITHQIVTTKQGVSSTIYIGYVRLNILTSAATATASPTPVQTSGVQRLTSSAIGHPVSTSRVFLSLGITIATLVALVVLIYASIYGSIISVGRNPLAKYAVFRTLGSVLGMAALVAAISGLVIFFLLR